MSHVGDELPNASVRHQPARHAGVPDAVFDVVEDLAVRLVLDAGLAKVGRMRILPCADLGLAAAVVRMANLALFPVHLVSSSDVRAPGIGLDRTLEQPTF